MQLHRGKWKLVPSYLFSFVLTTDEGGEQGNGRNQNVNADIQIPPERPLNGPSLKEIPNLV